VCVCKILLHFNNGVKNSKQSINKVLENVFGSSLTIFSLPLDDADLLS